MSPDGSQVSEADSPSAGASPPPAAPSPAEATPTVVPTWRAELRVGAGAAHAWLMRPRVRLTLVGVVLLMTGALVLTNSVWTLPLVIIGAMMVGTAWIGHRLEGRFAIEWGQSGTQLAFRATIKAARQAVTAPALGAGDAGADALAPAADIIEGEAHTVEIDVAELKALIAAAEAAEAADTPPETTVPRIHIHRIDHNGAHSPDAA